MHDNRRLGKVTAKHFDEFLVIAFSKKWCLLNDEKPIEFDVELKEGKIVLIGNLARLTTNTKEVVSIEM